MLTLVSMVRADSIRAVTYNVLADNNDADQRVPALLKILENSDADIIALQEVAPWFHNRLIEQPWSKKYHFPTQENRHFLPRGLLILSKSPIDKIDFGFVGGQQHRAYLTINTTFHNTPFSISTCHLESPLASGNIRAKQMELIFGKLQEQPNVILLGDFNFGDKEPEDATIPNNYKDAWLITNPKDKGFTWNIELNPMAKNGSFPNEPSRRLDRILIKSEKFTPETSAIIGNKPVLNSKMIFPSDHFGVISSFKKIPENK